MILQNRSSKNKKKVVSVNMKKHKLQLVYLALDQVKGAYFEVRETYARSKYGKKVSELDERETQELRDEIPIIISIAEPEQIKK
jgi:hypothetical protein